MRRPNKYLTWKEEHSIFHEEGGGRWGVKSAYQDRAQTAQPCSSPRNNLFSLKCLTRWSSQQQKPPIHTQWQGHLFMKRQHNNHSWNKTSQNHTSTCKVYFKDMNALTSRLQAQGCMLNHNKNQQTRNVNIKKAQHIAKDTVLIIIRAACLTVMISRLFIYTWASHDRDFSVS